MWAVPPCAVRIWEHSAQQWAVFGFVDLAPVICSEILAGIVDPEPVSFVGIVTNQFKIFANVFEELYALYF